MIRAWMGSVYEWGLSRAARRLVVVAFAGERERPRLSSAGFFRQRRRRQGGFENITSEKEKEDSIKRSVFT